MFVKCYDVASMVIKMATERFDGLLIDEDLIAEFEKKCNAIDTFSKGSETSGCNESYGYDVDVDVTTQEIVIGITFDMCEFQEKDPMYEIMRASNDIKIEGFQENVDYDMSAAIRMIFRLPGVWRKNE